MTTKIAMAAAVLVSAGSASVTEAAAQATPAPAAGQKVVLVTGSTSGLGRELALRLGARGDHVIVHGRSEERGAEVVDAINAAGPGSARFYRADFASFAEVRTFAETLLADYDRMDILINNAGFGSAPDERWVTEDGHEYRFQVNYLSTFLLTHMLMPRLLESTPARIVNVSSGAQTPIDFDDVMIENDFSGRRAYAQSKLAQIMFTHDLAEDLAGTGIVVGSLHPAAYMPTGMVRRLGATPRHHRRGRRRDDAGRRLRRLRERAVLQRAQARRGQRPGVRPGGARPPPGAESGTHRPHLPHGPLPVGGRRLAVAPPLERSGASATARYGCSRASSAARMSACSGRTR